MILKLPSPSASIILDTTHTRVNKWKEIKHIKDFLWQWKLTKISDKKIKLYCVKIFFLWHSVMFMFFIPYPVVNKWLDFALVQNQTSLHLNAVWPGYILLADQIYILILISLKMIMDSSKKMWIHMHIICISQYVFFSYMLTWYMYH